MRKERDERYEITERERERWSEGGRERERDAHTDRQTDRLEVQHIETDMI